MLDLVVPTRFRPMPGLISSTVGFSNVIFIHKLAIAPCQHPRKHSPKREREREAYVALLIGSYSAFSYLCYYSTISISLASQPPLMQKRVWSKPYRHRVSVHRIVCANQTRVSLSHDSQSMPTPFSNTIMYKAYVITIE